MGTVEILNVGEGDTKLVFDKNNPQERERAAKIVQDMLQRGYALLVEVGRDDNGQPLYQRAHGFDPNTCEYIIASAGDEVVDIGHDVGQSAAEPRRKKRGRPQKRVPADSVRTVGVARTAGG